ncbi:hypothetical protein [Primorskyibacter sp. S87]|uniref:hypothetical protein n=1 Tax=Primorskyibacter sp. S87 TaxID=3415126 RepID=UPI003C7DD470
MPSSKPSLYDELDPIQASCQEVDEAETDQAIRNLFVDETDPEPVKRRLAGSARTKVILKRGKAKVDLGGGTRQDAGDMPEAYSAREQHKVDMELPGGRLGSGAGESAPPQSDAPADATGARRRRITYEPHWWHSALILVVAIFIYSPLLIPVLVFLGLSAFAVAYLTVGPDRYSEISEAAFLRFERMAPDSAARVLAFRDRMARRIDAALRVLPDSWRERIGLPLMDEDQPRHAKMDQDPFEKLAAQAREM